MGFVMFSLVLIVHFKTRLWQRQFSLHRLNVIFCLLSERTTYYMHYDLLTIHLVNHPSIFEIMILGV